MREINLYHLQLMDLELFLNVADCGSFTKAGEKMFMTQSWVSKRINLMERELGLSLFSRNKREVTLTPAGQVLEERLRRITDDILSAIQAAHTAQTGVSGSLRLGFLEWGTIVFLPQLESFMKQNPQLSVEIYRQQFSELRTNISTGRVDLIFTMSYDCDQFSSEQYNQLHVQPVPMVAYMQKNHPLAGRALLEVEDLRAEPLLMVDQKSSSGYGSYVHQLFQAHNIRPLIAHYANGGGAHIGNVLLNKGILLASQYFLENSWEDQIARVPIRGADLYVSAIWRKQNSNPVLHKFLADIAGDAAARLKEP